MFTWLKRRTAAPASQPGRKSVATPVRTPTRSAPPRPDAGLRHMPRFADTAPLPEVVAEGNTQADWSMWEDSVMAMDSQMQEILPGDRVYVRDSRPSQMDDVDAFASVRGKRDI
ncbi:hypothetical protein [Ramlibacter sp. AN1133]|uniref:hypothetical protein n=1 Tax=Ramlibacter sp. AN1133 TaxID=3133429 RepID=UPI0030BAFADE